MIIVAVIVVNANDVFQPLEPSSIGWGERGEALPPLSSSHDVDLAQAAGGVESAVEDSMFLDGDEVEVSAYQRLRLCAFRSWS